MNPGAGLRKKSRFPPTCAAAFPFSGLVSPHWYSKSGEKHLHQVHRLLFLLQIMSRAMGLLAECVILVSKIGLH